MTASMGAVLIAVSMAGLPGVLADHDPCAGGIYSRTSLTDETTVTADGASGTVSTSASVGICQVSWTHEGSLGEEHQHLKQTVHSTAVVSGDSVPITVAWDILAEADAHTLEGGSCSVSDNGQSSGDFSHEVECSRTWTGHDSQPRDDYEDWPTCHGLADAEARDPSTGLPLSSAHAEDGDKC